MGQEKMSTNEKLEYKVNELTDAVKGLSDRPLLSSSDINELLNNLVSKVEETNLEGFSNLSNEISESLISILEKKYEDIKEKLSLFEDAVKTLDGAENPKLESEITRILNDIEALHSKMSSQEIQMESLMKGFEAVKNASGAGQISKLCDEIASVSKSYDGIGEILDNNFKEFLKRVETTSSRDEFQRLRYNIENLDSNQNVLVSAMNAVNEKQDEIKNIIKQTSASQNLEKMEQVQSAINQMNRLILDTTSKADLEVMTDRISAVMDLIGELKRSFDETKEDGIKSVLNGQLNNITAQLESLKMNSSSNVGEDIIRLYTSVAEFKDSIYSSINNQLNDVLTSMDVQFDKITNSVVNATLDANETVNNLAGEVQKLNSVVVDGLNTKAYEIKQDIQKQSHENILTVVNSIKGELNSLLGELSSLSNSDSISQLAKNIENLQNGIDIDSLIIQMDQIKQALDLSPIQEQLTLLNKDETIKAINEKIDVIIGYVRSTEILDKLDEISKIFNLDGIQASIEEINDKLDLNVVNDKIESVKQYLENLNIEENRDIIKEKLEKIANISKEASFFEEFETSISGIKEKIEENIRLNVQKIDEDKNTNDEIKDALKAIYGSLTGMSEDNSFIELMNSVRDNLDVYSSKITSLIQDNEESRTANFEILNEKIEKVSPKVQDSIEEARANLENSLSAMSEKINDLDAKLTNSNDESLIEIKDKLDNLYEFTRNMNSNPISEQLASLKEQLSDINSENLSDIHGAISNFKNNLSESLDLIKNNLNDALDKNALDEFFTPMFDELKAKLEEKIETLEEAYKGSSADYASMKSDLIETLDSLESKIRTSIFSVVEETINSKTDMIVDVVSDSANSTNVAMATNIKNEIENLKTYIKEGQNTSREEALLKISELINESAKTPEKISFMKNVIKNLTDIHTNTNAVKEGFEANSDFINELSQKLDLSETKIVDAIKAINTVIVESNVKESFKESALEIKKLIGRSNENIAAINSSLLNEIPNKEKFNELVEQLKESAEDIKAEIENISLKNEDKTNSLSELTNSIEEKIGNKISILENLIDDGIEKINEKAVKVLSDGNSTYENILSEKLKEAVSSLKENNDANAADIPKILDEKLENVVSSLKENNDTNIADIQKLIDEKVFDIVSKNNDILKDELKYRADAISRELANNIEKLNKQTEVQEDETTEDTYSIKDVESDLAKIRLSLEKTNKITNFKEFASRLVELKNINLENAKISRVIGADIMRFDGWLKNTTAKIELLAAKIEKSEKIKMEDLKSRLIQSEKNQAMPQKLEEIVMSIYKKYRSQETKVDDLISKIEILSNKQADTFDMKEFIDLFYDTTKKQENLMGRMDSIEDKMDLIQAKLDHIISTCIDGVDD